MVAEMTEYNFERIERIAESDPHVDINRMSDYMRREYGNGLDSKSSGASDEQYETFEFGYGYAVQSGGIRGENVRPNMGDSSLQNEAEKLRNTPGEDGEFEVYKTDPIPLITYKKMSTDPEIAFGTFLLKGWISGLPYTIECADPVIKGVVDYALSSVWKSIVRNMLDAIAMGFAFGEKVWQREQVKIPYVNDDGEDDILYEGKMASLLKVKFLDPDQGFQYFKDKTDEIVRVMQKQGRTEVSVKRGKLVWFALDRRYSSVFGTSRYKNIYAPWYYSKLNTQYLLNDLQKRGAPHLEIRYPRGNSMWEGEPKPNSEVAMNIAKMLMNQGVVALPSETNDSGDKKWEIGFADTKHQSGQVNPFIEWLKYSDSKKMKGLGIPPAVADGDSNFSTADAQSDMLVIIIEDIVNQLEEAIQDDVTDQIVENNFGPEFKSMVSLKIDKSALGRRNLAKEILKTMLRSGSSMQGHTLKSWPDPANLIKELGLSTSTFDGVFTEVQGADRPEGETPLDEAEDDEDSNTDARRDGKDERERERQTEREDATDVSD